MKSVLAAAACCLWLPIVWAQAAPQTPPPPAGPAHAHHYAGLMGLMHQQHRAEMKAQLDKMRAKVDEMKANPAKVKDSAAKQPIQLDADRWEMVVSHMEGMQKMMADQSPMGMMHPGMMGMHRGEMEEGCCAGMKEGEMHGGCCKGGKCMQGLRIRHPVDHRRPAATSNGAVFRELEAPPSRAVTERSGPALRTRRARLPVFRPAAAAERTAGFRHWSSIAPPAVYQCAPVP